MTVSVFMLAFLGAVASYALAGQWLDRRARAAAVRRLTGKGMAGAGAHRGADPALMRVADELRGRLAAGILDRMHLKRKAGQLLETADLKWGATGLIHRSIALFLAAFAIATMACKNRHPYLALLAGGLAGLLPLIYVRRKAALRVRRFEEQFPDCLEFVSRSMRAGHAFSVSLEMIQREFSEPVSGEFRRTFEEQNLGQPLEIVLRKLSERIPSIDVRFFVSAVLLQKRTGGNLAELLDKLAHLVRERFKLRARIRTISAQGVMSGRILSAIPAVVGALMFLVNPKYARFFVDDPVGHALLGASLGLQVLGYLIIRKIVRIEV